MLGLSEPRSQTSRIDLIALDSPFIADPAKGVSVDSDFKAVWDSMKSASVRGWCEAPLDMIVRLLQSLQYRMRVIATDQFPFEGARRSCGNLLLTQSAVPAGELKVLVQGPEAQQCAALRLREGDDDSCLWRLRCDDLELRTSIKRLIEDM